MKCPNCGAPLTDGNLFCEKCGEEIHIVPNYDPDTDLSVDIEGVFDKTRELDTYEVKRKKKITRNEEDYEDRNRRTSKRKMIDDDDSDWDDDETNEVLAIKDIILSLVDYWNKSIFSKIVIVFTILLIAGVITTFGFMIKKISDKQSIDYLVEQAEYSYDNKDYENAIDLYEKAIEKDPDNVKIKYAISNCYIMAGQDKNAIFILQEIANDNPALEEDAYERIFNIYSENEDYNGINDFLLGCSNETIVNRFKDYLCKKPEFSLKPGEYEEEMTLELTNDVNGFIYYTLDGSEPDENSFLYTEPILLASGEYDVKAVFVSQLGVISEMNEAEYNIKIKIPLAPQVSIESGSYNVPIVIKVETDINCETYYVEYRPDVKAEDRVDPDKNSTLYEYPLIMPMGASEFRFISYNEEGIPSTVITRKYNITIPDATVSKEEAANIATVYRYSLGGMQDTDGNVSTAKGRFEFIIEDAVNIKNTIYYVINEYYVDYANGNKRTLTGLRFAVNINDSNDYGTLELNAKGDYYIIKERSVNSEY